MLLIRAADVRDAERLMTVRAESASKTPQTYYSKEIIHSWTAASSKEPVDCEYKRILDPRILTYLAEYDRRIVGFGRLNLGTKTLMQLYMLPTFQGRGISRKIMKVLEKEALKNGLDEITLSASLIGEGFYAKIGYVYLYSYDFILHDQQKMKCIMMKKSLKKDKK